MRFFSKEQKRGLSLVLTVTMIVMQILLYVPYLGVIKAHAYEDFGGGDPWGGGEDPWIEPDPGAFSFLYSPIVVDESAGTINISVDYTGNYSDVTVDYTINGYTGSAATAGLDYTAAASGTLTFASGPSSEFITINIIDDEIDEDNNESFMITLSNPPYGVSISPYSSVEVIIVDNDEAPSTEEKEEVLWDDPVYYGAGDDPSGTAFGDFNHDGRTDMAVANRNSGNVSIFNGSGDGSFSEAENYSTGKRPQDLITADFNSDGKVDLAAADASLDSVVLLMGSGDGTFQTGENYGAGDSPVSIVSGDFNSDGKADLATANYISDNISVLLGSGDGTFQTAKNYTTGDGANSLTIGDFDGDGKTDLAVANRGSGNVSVLLGTGDGTFQSAVNYSVGRGPIKIVTADFNGDGNNDLATCNNWDRNISILLGNGNGTFQVAVNLSEDINTYLLSLAAGDFNQDGSDDIVIGQGNNVSVMFGNGDGTFDSLISVPVEDDTKSLFGADLNNDGRLDLVGAFQDIYIKTDKIFVLLNAYGVSRLTFDADNYKISEYDSTVSITVNRSGDTSESVEVDYLTVDGTAKAGADYTEVWGTLRFDVGEKSKTISVPVSDDSLVEENESFQIMLDNPTGGGELGKQNVARIIIEDNEQVGQLDFGKAVYSVDEGAEIVTLAVYRTGGSDGTIRVNYVTADVSAIAGSDYQENSGTLTFEPGETTETFTVIINEDSFSEGEEKFSVNLSDVIDGAVLGTVTEAEIKIIDNEESGILDFSQTELRVNEGETVTIIVNRTGGSNCPVEVDYTMADGSTNADSDYQGESGTLIFNTDEVQKTITLNIKDDKEPEGEETFSVTLSNPTNGAVLGTDVTTQVSIVDDETPGSLEFGQALYNMNEEEQSVTVAVYRNGGSDGEVLVNYIIEEGSAKNGVDYQGDSGSITFGTGEVYQEIYIALVDDDLVEGTENFTVKLTDPRGMVSLGEKIETTVNIIDDELAGQIEFAQTESTVSEGDQKVTVTVIRTGGSDGIVTVDCTAVNGTAELGSDFLLDEGTITFEPGQTIREFDINIVNDNIYEDTETFKIKLESCTGGVSLGTHAETVVNILDDEQPGLVQFEQSEYSVSEGDGTVTLTLMRTEGSDGEFSVDYACQDGTAQNESDYHGTIGSVIFKNGEVTRELTLDIIDDIMVEDTENFTVSLSSPTNGAALGSQSTVVVNILEDTGNIEFGESAFSVGEDQVPGGLLSYSLAVPVIRTGSTEGTVTVHYAVQDGTAMAGEDFQSASGVLTFGPGETSKNITVNVINDSLAEGDEAFSIILSSPDEKAVLGEQKTVDVTIVEDDASLEFSQAVYPVDEGAKTVDVTVIRRGKVDVPQSVQYVAGDGTATDGEDYQASAGTLELAAGETIKAFSINIIQDTLEEDKETVKVTLINSSDTVDLGTMTEALIEIIDDDVTFQQPERYSVGEKPQGTVTGDFNEDGYLDMAVANYNSGNVSILLGTGAGKFAWKENNDTGSGAKGISTGDFNGDGHIDLAVTNFDANNVSILLGNGDGTFSLKEHITVGDEPTNTSAADFDGDGNLDLVVANFNSKILSILLGNGDGTFVLKENKDVGYSPNDAAVGDFNGDGITDLAVMKYYSLDHSVSIFLGSGDGSFSLKQNLDAGNQSNSITTGDFNEDGNTDLIVTTVNSLYIFTGNGDGTFSLKKCRTVSEGPVKTAVGDFNGDGHGDLVVGTTQSTSVFVLLGNGDASFPGELVFNAEYGPGNVVTGDFDGNGRMDFAAANSRSNNVSVFANNRMYKQIGFSTNEYNVSEDGESITVTVNRTGNTINEETVDLVLENGTAEAGKDYSVVGGTIRFGVGETSRTITIEVLDDQLVEGTETVNLKLKNPSEGIALGIQRATVNIVDDEQPGQLEFAQTEYGIFEGEGKVTVTVNRTDGSYGEVTVNYSVTGGSAQSESDYQPFGGTLIFKQEETTKTFDIIIADDSILEETETINLSLSSPTDTVELGNAVAVVSIYDNEQAGIVEFDSIEYNADESSGNVQITVNRVGGSTGEVSVECMVENGTAEEGSDFNLVSNVLNFADGETSQTFTIEIIDDFEKESSETVNLQLQNPIGGGIVGSNDKAVLNITEQVSVLEFEEQTYYAGEGDTFTVTVKRTGGNDGTVTVEYAGEDETAQAGTDYSVVNGILTFNREEMVKSFTVSTVNDQLAESLETFHLVLKNIDKTELSEQSRASVNIIDNELSLQMEKYSAGGDPRSLAAGDFDGNGSVDLAVINSDQLFIKLANGDGTFEEGQTYDFEAWLNSITTYDFNDDEILDLAVTNDYKGNVSILLGQGDGTFQSGGKYDVSQASGVITGDFDGDNITDLVVANGYYGDISILRGMGNGTFQGAVDVKNYGEYVLNVISGDFNGDGNLDLAAADYGEELGSKRINDNVAVLLGNGDGTFQRKVIYDAGEAPIDITTGDFDGDGNLDLAAANRYSDNISVLLGLGDGTFGAAVNYAAGDGPRSIVSGDFNSDGLIDLVTANYNHSSVTVLLGTGNGQFLPRVSFNSGGPALRVISCDFDGDGSLDLAVANGWYDSVGNLAVLLNRSSSGKLEFSEAEFSATENSGTVQITVKRTGGFAGSVSVEYEVFEGTATTGIDYQIAAGTLDFAQGEKSKTFELSINDDVLTEGDETVNLRLRSVGGALLGTTDTAVLTIIDVEERGSFQFSTPEYSASEDQDSVLLSVYRVGGSDGAVTVDYAAKNKTALAGLDYTAASGKLFFAHGEISQSFSINILNDNLVEDIETIDLILENPSGGAELIEYNTATLNIVDDEKSGQLEFAQAEYNIEENIGTLMITVNRVGGSDGDIAVEYTLKDNNAVSGIDFETVGGILNFAHGETSKSFNINIIDDSLIEENEEFELNLSNPTGGIAWGEIASAVVIIEDNDGADFGEGEAIQVGIAPCGVVSGDFNKDGISDAAVLNSGSGNVSVLLGTRNEIMENVINYSVGENPRGITSGDFNNDGNTDLAVSVEDKNVAVLMGQGDGTFENVINYPITVYPHGIFSYDFNNDGKSDLVVSNNGKDGRVWILLADSKGRFGDNIKEYRVGSGPVNMAVGKFDKDWGMGLAVVNRDSNNVSVSIGIVQQVRGKFSFGMTPSNVGQRPSDIAACDFNRDGRSELAVVNSGDDTVSVMTSDMWGHFYEAPKTYSVGNEPVGVATGDFNGDGNFDIVTANADSNDVSLLLGKENEGFLGVVNKSVGHQPADIAAGDFNGDGTLDILTVNQGANMVSVLYNSLIPSVQFGQAEYRVDEKAGSIDIIVRRFGGTVGPGAVEYVINGGTALEGEDYVINEGTLEFASGVAEKTITIDIFDDILLEENENVNLLLKNPVGAVLGQQTTAVLNIIDEAAGRLEFSQADYSLWEAEGCINVTVNRIGGNDGAAEVQYSTGDGTSLADIDYQAVSGVLEFGAGEMSKNFQININDDKLAENNEIVHITLSNPTGRVELGAQSTAVLTILDEDGPGVLSFSQPEYSISEEGISAVVTVNRTVGYGGTVTVEYVMEDGTASAGEDYQVASGMLTFEDGETSKTLHIKITDDTIEEDEETINLSLKNPNGGAILGEQSSAVLNILNNDGPGIIEFDETSYVKYSYDGGYDSYIPLIINRTGGSEGYVSVFADIDSGTATYGDYDIPSNQYLLFTPGESRKILKIYVHQKGRYGAKKSFNVTLKNPTGEVELGSKNTATVSIVNDYKDYGRLGFEQYIYRVSEDGGSADITVSRKRGSEGKVAVDYTILDNSTTSGLDYNAISNGTLVFEKGETSKTVTIDIIDDKVVDADEDLYIILSNPKGRASLSESSRTRLVIEDDEYPGVDFEYEPEERFPEEEIVFDASKLVLPDDGKYNYRWNFGDGAWGFGKSTTHAYKTTSRNSYGWDQKYTVTLDVFDENGTQQIKRVNKEVTVIANLPVEKWVLATNASGISKVRPGEEIFWTVSFTNNGRPMADKEIAVFNALLNEESTVITNVDGEAVYKTTVPPDQSEFGTYNVTFTHDSLNTDASMLVYTQNVILNGRVFDSQTGKPIYGARVGIYQNGRQKGVRTDSDGQYSIGGIRSGEQFWVDVFDGYWNYEEKSEKMTINSEQAVKNFSLKPKKGGDKPVINLIDVDKISYDYDITPEGKWERIATEEYFTSIYYGTGYFFIPKYCVRDYKDVKFDVRVYWYNHPPGTVKFIVEDDQGNTLREYEIESPSISDESSFVGENEITKTFNTVSDLNVGEKIKVVAISEYGVESEIIDTGITFNDPAPRVDTEEVVEQSLPPLETPSAPDIPFMKDTKIALDFSGIQSYSVYDQANGVLTIYLGYKATKAKEQDKDRWKLKELKNTFKQVKENGKFKSSGVDFSLEAGGSFGYVWNAETKDWAFKKGAFNVVADVEAGKTFYYATYPIPIPVYVDGRMGAKLTSTMDFDWVDTVVVIGNVTPEVWARIAGGVGVRDILSGEVWGKISGNVNYKFNYDTSDVIYGIAIGAGYKLSYLLGYYEKELIGYKWDSENGGEGHALSAMALPTFGEMKPLSRNYLKEKSRWMPKKFSALAEEDSHISETIIQTNVFPYSEPGIIVDDDFQMLVWVTDDSDRSDMNRTTVVYSQFDGSTWTEPVQIENDGTADFHPETAKLSEGAAAVWMNNSSSLEDTADLGEMMEDMEIAASVYNSKTNSWSSVENLTSDQYYDNSPQIASNDDEAMVVWIKNRADDYMSSEALNKALFFEPENTDIMFSQWNGTSWSVAEAVYSGVGAVERGALAYSDDQAVYAYILDGDADAETIDDQELYVVTYSNKTGLWSNPVQITANGVQDTNPKVCYLGENPMVFWYQDGKIVYLSQLDEVDAKVAVEGSVSSGMEKFDLAVKENGSLALVWGEGADACQEIVASVYDSSFDSWSKKIQLTENGSINRSIDAALDEEGNILAVYNKVAVEEQEDRIVLGDTHLAFAELNIGRDLSVDAQEIFFSEENPAPGSRVTITALISNQGELAEKDVKVAFYDGNPTDGGEQIGDSQIITDTIRAGDSAPVSVEWDVPAAFSSHDIYVVVDPENIKADRDRNNNQAYVGVVKPDLQISEVRTEPMGSSKYLVNVKVANSGYLVAPDTVISLNRGESSESEIGMKNIGDLKPGDQWEESFIWEFNGSDFENDIAELYAKVDSKVSDAVTSNNIQSIFVRQPITTQGIKVSGIQLNKISLKMAPGTVETLVESILPESASNHKVIWHSENESTAVVDENGKVTALNYGATVITAVTEDGAFSENCLVEVISPPEITLTGSDEVNLVVGESFVDPGAVAIYGGKDISTSIEKTGEQIDTSIPGTYQINYYCTALDGAKAQEKTRTVIVRPTSVGPEGCATAINVTNAVPFALLKLFNEKDVEIKSGLADENGTYQFTPVSIGEGYYVIQTVDAVESAPSNRVTVGSSKPVIRLTGEKTVLLIVGDSYTDAGAMAQDDSGNTVTTTKSGTVDTTNAGRYFITYNAVDNAGNAADEVTRTVIVLPKAVTALGGRGCVNISGADIGTVLVLHDKAGNVVTTGIADDSGTYTFSDVEIGSGYYVTQTVNGLESGASNEVKVKAPSGSSSKGSSYGNSSAENSKKIYSNKGGILSYDDASVEIPADMLPENAVIKIEKISSNGVEKILPKGLGLKLSSNVYDITTTGSSDFGDENITIRLPYNHEKLGNDEKPIICYYDEDSEQWVEIETSVEYDQAENKWYAVILVNHLTRFAVFAKTSEEEGTGTVDGVFTDIENHWAQDDIEFMVDKQIVKGITKDKFAPNDHVTRAQFTTLLVRCFEIVPESGGIGFTDVPENAWHMPYIKAAVEAGLVKGMNDNIFAPSSNITREQMAVMIMRAYEYRIGHKLPEGNLEFFDSDDISPWAEGSVVGAAEAGIIKGMTETTFCPKANATRAQSVVMLKRLMQM